jgi:hypothetical protein
MTSKVIVGVDGLQGDLDAVALSRTLAPKAELVLARAYPFDVAPTRFALAGYGAALRKEAKPDVTRSRDETGVTVARIELIPDTAPARALRLLAEREGAADAAAPRPTPARARPAAPDPTAPAATGHPATPRPTRRAMRPTARPKTEGRTVAAATAPPSSSHTAGCT